MKTKNGSSCPAELELASYLAGTLSPDQKSTLEAHFADCSECRRSLVELVRMGTVSEESVAPISLPRAWERVESELRKWDSSSESESVSDPDVHGDRPSSLESRDAQAALGKTGDVIRLFHRPIVHNCDKTGHALAASSVENEALSRVTFATEDDSILGKFLRDEGSEEVSLFLISEDMGLVRNALVRIRNSKVGFEAEGVPDENGIFPLGKVPELVPSETSFELKIPDATFQLEPRKWRDHLVGESTFELSSPEGRTLRIEVVERGVRREYRLDLSDLCAERPECTLRVYVTDARHAEEVKVGPNGIAWLREQEPEAESTTVRAYVVSP